MFQCIFSITCITAVFNWEKLHFKNELWNFQEAWAMPGFCRVMQEELWKTSCLELHCSNGRQPITVIVRLLLFNKMTPLYVECSSAEEKARHQYPPCTFPICLHNYSMVLEIFHLFYFHVPYSPFRLHHPMKTKNTQN